MYEDYTLHGYRTEFCQKPDGSVTSQHEFVFVPGTARREGDYEYALFACVCHQTLRGSCISGAQS